MRAESSSFMICCYLTVREQTTALFQNRRRKPVKPAATAREDRDAGEPETDVFLTAREVADFLRMDVRTLNNARCQNRGLPYTKTPTGGVRYLRSDVLKAIENGQCGWTESRVNRAIDSFDQLDDKTKDGIKAHLSQTVWHDSGRGALAVGRGCS